MSAFFICSSNPFEATFIAPTVRNKNVDNATVNPISAPKLSITNVPAAVPISNIIEAAAISLITLSRFSFTFFSSNLSSFKLFTNVITALISFFIVYIPRIAGNANVPAKANALDIVSNISPNMTKF